MITETFPLSSIGKHEMIPPSLPMHPTETFHSVLKALFSGAVCW